MQRTTPITVINPTDDSPIPAPKLTFGTQPPKPLYPTGGLHSTGNIKFDLNKTVMVNLAKEAFLDNSDHKDDPDAMNIFLLSLAVTSAFEGGFDGVNTYDKAGISVGFVQFARPEEGVGKLLELLGRNDLSAKIKQQFGTSDPHNSPSALKARFDTALLTEVVTAISTEDGIKAQLAMAINQNVDGQLYFQIAYNKFLELKLSDPLSCALLFDASINMGVGCLKHFTPCNPQGADGSWIASSINKLSQPERRAGWQKILSQNFA